MNIQYSTIWKKQALLAMLLVGCSDSSPVKPVSSSENMTIETDDSTVKKKKLSENGGDVKAEGGDKEGDVESDDDGDSDGGITAESDPEIKKSVPKVIKFSASSLKFTDSGSGSVNWEVTAGDCQLSEKPISMTGALKKVGSGLTGSYGFSLQNSAMFTLRCDYGSTAEPKSVVETLSVVIEHSPRSTLEIFANNAVRSSPHGTVFGEGLAVKWTSEYVDSCELFSRLATEAEPGTPIAASKTLQGSHDVSGLTKKTIFTLKCVAAAKGSIQDQIATIELKGSWIQANQQVCPNFCSGLNKTNGRSPEGFRCTSGESVAGSALGVISFGFGCFPAGCPASISTDSSSSGQFCYRPGQKADSDASDRTVGCFCE